MLRTQEETVISIMTRPKEDVVVMLVNHQHKAPIRATMSMDETLDLIQFLRDALEELIVEDPSKLPTGLCGNRDDHSPHTQDSDSLGLFWCHADQSQRQPNKAERERRGEG